MISHTVYIHDGGGVSHRAKMSQKKKSGGGKRGNILGASKKAERALRRFLLENTADGECWAVTLTIRHHATPEVWRDQWAAMAAYCRRRSLPVVWRLELQKRGVPHIHCVVWGTEEHCSDIRVHWLSLWGVSGCPDHRRYSVDIRPANGGWYGYVALHQGKHSVQGNLWEGRTWGVLCRSLFREREKTEFVLTAHQYQYVRRMLNWIYCRRGRNRELAFLSSWDALGEDYLTTKRVVARAIRLFPDGASFWEMQANFSKAERCSIAYSLRLDDPEIEDSQS